MNQSIISLESRRKSLYLQLEELEDFRRGTVSLVGDLSLQTERGWIKLV